MYTSRTGIKSKPLDIWKAEYGLCSECPSHQNCWRPRHSFEKRYWQNVWMFRYRLECVETAANYTNSEYISCQKIKRHTSFQSYTFKTFFCLRNWFLGFFPKTFLREFHCIYNFSKCCFLNKPWLLIECASWTEYMTRFDNRAVL